MSELSQLLLILDQAFDKPSWHGTNLRGSIRRVSPELASWRPASGRHNIWENMVHAAYWKYAASRRFVDQKRGSFPEKGSNWFTRPKEFSARAWKADIALLDEMHEQLRQAVARLPARALQEIPPGKKASNFFLLSGIAAHDLYHAGQIQLLKKLARS